MGSQELLGLALKNAVPLVQMLSRMIPGAANLFRQVINGGDVSQEQIQAAIDEVKEDVLDRSARIQAAGGQDGE